MVIAQGNVMVETVRGLMKFDEALVPHPFDTLTILLAVWFVELLGRDRFTSDSLDLLYKTLALPLKSRID